MEQTSEKQEARLPIRDPYIFEFLFEERVGQIASPKGAKAEMVLNAIQSQTGEFRLADIERTCPGVGREWIRVLLADLKKSGDVLCKGKGPAARWVYKRSKGTTLK